MIVISIASSGAFTITSSRLGIFTFANRKAIALLHFVALVGAKSAILMGDAIVTVTKKLNLVYLRDLDFVCRGQRGAGGQMLVNFTQPSPHI